MTEHPGVFASLVHFAYQDAVQNYVSEQDPGKKKIWRDRVLSFNPSDEEMKSVEQLNEEMNQPIQFFGVCIRKGKMLDPKKLVKFPTIC